MCRGRSLAGGGVGARVAGSSIEILEDGGDDVGPREAMQGAREGVQRADAGNLYLPEAGDPDVVRLRGAGGPRLCSEVGRGTGGRAPGPALLPRASEPGRAANRRSPRRGSVVVPLSALRHPPAAPRRAPRGPVVAPPSPQ